MKTLVQMPIPYGNVQDAVADRIRELVLSNSVKPGEWLRQDELAATLGVSTMPVREALRQLQTEGLVTFYPRRGVTVSEISTEEYQEIYRMREELELLACHWAAEHFERIPLDRLKTLFGEMETAAQKLDFERHMEVVREFFFLIFRASQKTHLLRVLSSLWDLSQRYRRYFSTHPDIVPARLANYRRVYSACEAQDPQALEQCIRDIFAFGKARLMPLLRDYDSQKQTR